MSTTSRTLRVASIAALAGFFAAAALGAGPNDAPKEPGYFRIAVTEKCAIYLEFRGDDLRAATSVEGLKSAQPVKRFDVEGPEDNYPRFTLPIPPDQLPKDIAAVTTTCAYPRSGKVSDKFVHGQAYFHIAMCRTDENKTRWEFAPILYEKASASPDSAPAMALPNPNKLSLAVVPGLSKAAPGKLEIVLQLKADGKAMQLVDVKAGGKSAMAHIRVVDDAGKVIVSKTGELSDFGMS